MNLRMVVLCLFLPVVAFAQVGEHACHVYSLDEVSQSLELKATSKLEGSFSVENIHDNVIVMRYSGPASDFEVSSEHPIDYTVRRELMRAFYQQIGDVYDMVALTSEFDYIHNGANGFNIQIKNDIEGIGLPIVDRSVDFHSQGKLKGFIELGSGKYFWKGETLVQEQFQYLMLHEIGHRWLAFVSYLKAGQFSADLMMQAPGHWSFLLDSEGSHMYGHDWNQIDEGRWSVVNILSRYSNLDLYLMGMLPAEKVGPITLLHSPQIADSSNLLPLREKTLNAVAESIDISQIIGAEGPRSPAYDSKTKNLRFAFIYLYADVAPSYARLEQLNRGLTGLNAVFQRQTLGLGHLDYRPAPYLSSNVSVDSTNALNFLSLRKNAQGLWADSDATVVRDTIEVIRALAFYGRPYETELNALSVWQDRNLDETARIAAFLAEFNRTPTDRIHVLKASQDEDGGFALRPGSGTNVLDTALALDALIRNSESANQAEVSAAVAYLLARQNGEFAWGQGSGTAFETALVLEVLERQSTVNHEAMELALARATTWLLSAQGVHGGLGQTDIDFNVTCHLQRTLALKDTFNTPARNFLTRSQSSNGSWNGTAHDTALVLNTLRILENLQVADVGLDPEQVLFSPDNPTLGQPWLVTARVTNYGNAPADNVRFSLYLNDPNDGGEEQVSTTLDTPLLPGESRQVQVIWDVPFGLGEFNVVLLVTTTSPDGSPANDSVHYDYHVSIVGPDAMIEAESILYSTITPLIGETLQVRANIINVGSQLATNVRISLYDGNPDQGGRLIAGPVSMPDLPPFRLVSPSLNWVATSPTGPHNLFLSLDSDLDMRWENNRFSQAISVRESISGVDVGINPLTVALAPAQFETAPQAFNLTFEVASYGQTLPSGVVVKWFQGPPESGLLLASTSAGFSGNGPIPLALQCQLDFLTDYDLYLTVAPAGGETDLRSENNRHLIHLAGLGLEDFEISPASFSASPLITGQTVHLQAQIQNRSLQPRTGVAVAFYQDTGAGFEMIGRTSVGLPGSGTALAQTSWNPPATAVSGVFKVMVDPDNMVAELDESDNSLLLNFETQLDTQANPHLAEDALSFSPGPYHEGESFSVTVRVQNSGGAVASGSVSLYLNNENGSVLSSARTFDDLPTDGEQLLTFSIDPIAFRGNQLIMAKLTASTAESNPADNIAYKSIYVVGGPNPRFAATALSLSPSWPAAGEITTVTASLENTGALAANGLVVVLRANDAAGDILAQTTLNLTSGSRSISFQFTASASIQRLYCQIDPDNQIVEQVETDNTASIGLILRQGEIAVDEPIFSPNGDGVKDQVTLFWNRPEPEIKLVLTNSSGDVMRTWTGLSGSGSLVWNGKDIKGKVLPDDFYLFQLVDPVSGFPLRDQTVTIDTNNGTIISSLATSDPGFYNIANPEQNLGAGWLGWSADTTSLLADSGSSGPALYVAPDGSSAQILGDAWATSGFSLKGQPGQWLVLESSDLAGRQLVHYVNGSMSRQISIDDGQVLAWVDPNHVLVWDDSDLLLLSLVDGTRTPCSRPDPGWGEFLGAFAYNGVIYALEQDESSCRILNFDVDGNNYRLFREYPFGNLSTLSHQGRYWILDFDGENGRDLIFFDLDTGLEQRWSTLYPGLAVPYAEDVFDDGRLFLVPIETGSSDFGVVGDWTTGRRFVVSESSIAMLRERISPDGTKIATARFGAFGQGIYTTRHNLGLGFEAFLTAAGAVQIQGTAVDRNFLDWQLDYANVADPEQWRPTGISGTYVVMDSFMGIWVPEHTGAYLLRLSARDKAGNIKSRKVLVEVIETLPFYDILRDPVYFSPNNDGVLDHVTFTFQVRTPFEASIQIYNADGVPVRNIAQFFGSPGAASLSWNGRNDQGQTVADGAYRLSFNGLNYTLLVDNTAPLAGIDFRDTVRGSVRVDGTSTQTLVTCYQLLVNDPNILSWRLERRPIGGSDWTLILADTGNYETGPYDDVLDFLPTIRQAFGHEFRVVAEDIAGNRTSLTRSPNIDYRVWTMRGGQGLGFQDLQDEPLSTMSYGGIELLNLEAVLPVDRYPLTLTAIEYAGSLGGVASNPNVVNDLQADQLIFNGPFIAPGLKDANLPPADIIFFRLVFSDAQGNLHKTEIHKRISIHFQVELVELVQREQGNWRVGYRITTDADTDQISGSLLGLTRSDKRFSPAVNFSGTWIVSDECVDSITHDVDTLWPDNDPPSPGKTFGNWNKFILENIVLFPGQANRVELGRILSTQFCATLVQLQALPTCRELGAPRAFKLDFPLVLEGGSIRFFADRQGTQPISVEYPLRNAPIVGPSMTVVLDDSVLALTGWNIIYAVLRDAEGHNIRFNVSLKDDFIALYLEDNSDSGPDQVQSAGALYVTHAPIRPLFGDQVLCAASAIEIEAWQRNRVSIPRVITFGSGRTIAYKPFKATEYGLSYPQSPLYRIWAIPQGQTQPLINFGLQSPGQTTIDIGKLLGFDAWVFHLEAINESGYCDETTATITFSDLGGGVNGAFEILAKDSATHVNFSPNGDHSSDEAQVRVKVKSTSMIAAWIETADDQNEVVAVIRSGGGLPIGTHSLTWSGRNSEGSIVADGVYRMVVVSYSACGASNQETILLNLDTQSPQASIDFPLPGVVRLPAALLVSGRDEHLLRLARLTVTPVNGSAQLHYELLDPPNMQRQALPGLTLVPGNYTLTWLVVDKAGNSTTVATAILVERNQTLDAFQLSETWISPNDDTVQDGTIVRFTLSASAQVNLELREMGGSGQFWPLRANQSLAPGTHELYFNGEFNGQPVSDGAYQVVLLVDTSQGLETSELELHIDRSPPSLILHQPNENGVYDAETMPIIVTASDGQGIAAWNLDYASASHPRALLASGNDELNYAVATELNHPETGSNQLFLSARDFAGNLTEMTRNFVRDPFSPILTLITPEEDQLFGPDQLIEVEGTYQEPYPESLAVFLEDAQGAKLPLHQFGPAELVDGAWSFAVPASTIADGTYRLSAVMTDIPGHIGEAVVAITVDSHPPVVALEPLPNGGVLTGPIDLRGTVLDPSLVSWELAIAPQSGGSFVTLFSDQRPVNEGKLYRWSVLPADGNWRLRLQAYDRAGQSSEVSVDVMVDQTPPDSPATLTANASQYGTAPDRFSRVALSWAPVVDPGLHGYMLYRNGILLTPEPLQTTSFLQDPVADGEWLYEVRAIDLVGNLSKDTAFAEVTLDTVPPLPNIANPRNGEVVGGLVSIRGSVIDDRLADWSLAVGVGLEPAIWETLFFSTESVAYGELHQWAAQGLAPGNYSIRLRARDSFGNLGDAVVAVSVENQVPSKPATPTVDAASFGLNIRWEANSESDINHYRLYRNDSFVTTVPATLTQFDDEVPDGTYVYRLIAVDHAGNRSPLSDPSEPFALDLRPPHVIWINPLDHARFETDLILDVFSADRDILSVTFQYRAAGSNTWVDIVTDGETPWQTLWATTSLSEGPYELRAMAVERNSGEIDPDPQILTVTKGDATSPTAPNILSHLITGTDVHLNWSAVLDPDLDHYRIFRGDAPLLEVSAASLSITVPEAPSGTQYYSMSAVDAAGNESPRSAAVEVYVFTPELDQSFALFQSQDVSFSGTGEPSYSSVNAYQNGTLLATAVVDALGRFQLVFSLAHPGENQVEIVQTHPDGHQSIAAVATAIVASEPLPALDLEGHGDGASPENGLLSWTEPTPAPSGYLVYADGVLQQGISQATITSATVSSSGSTASRLFDGSISTFWLSTSSDRTRRVTLNLSEPVAVKGLGIDWYTNFGKPTTVTVSARIDGLLLPLWQFPGNGPDSLDTLALGLTESLAVTDQLVLEMDHYNRVGIREIRVLKQDLLVQGQAQYTHLDPGSGIHAYALTSLSAYGRTSQAGPVLVGIGDYFPPEAPSGLNATVLDSDVSLSWQASTSADTVRYRIYRDGRILATTTAPATFYSDVAVHAGTFAYVVTAIDGSGNESGPSNLVTATVEAGVANPPVLTGYVDSLAGVVNLDWQYDTSHPAFKTFRVLRRQTGGNFQAASDPSLEPMVNGHWQDRASLRAGSTYEYSVAAVDQQDRENLSNTLVVTLPVPEPGTQVPGPVGAAITVFGDQAQIIGQASSGARVGVYRNNSPVMNLETNTELETLSVEFFNQEPVSLAASYDGVWLAYASLINNEIYLYNNLSQNLTIIETSNLANAMHFSPEGKHLAYIDQAETAESGMLKMLDMTTLTVSSPYASGPVSGPLAWRSSGNLCFSTGTEIYQYDLRNDQLTRLYLSDAVSLIGVDWGSDRLIVETATASTHTVLSLKSQNDALSWISTSQAYRYAWAASSRQLFAFAESGEVKQVFIGSDQRPLSAGLSSKGLLSAGSQPIGVSADGRRLVAQDPSGVLTLWHCGGDQLAFIDVLGEDSEAYAPTLMPSGEILAAYRPSNVFNLNHMRLPGFFSFYLPGLEQGANYISFDAVEPVSAAISERSDSLILTYSQERKPDLQIADADLRLIPAIVVPGQTAAVQVNVRNLGGGAAENVNLRWLLIGPDGGRLEPSPDQVIAVIPAQDLATVGFYLSPTNLVPGTYTLVATADPDEQVDDADRANNQGQLSFLFSPSASAQLDAHLASTEVTPLGELDFTTTVTNLGSSQHNVRVLAKVETPAGAVLATLPPWTLGELNTQAQLNHNWVWSSATLLAGAYRLHLLLVSDTAILAEKNLEFSLLGDPSLALTLNGLPAQVNAGAALSLSARLTNTSSNVAFEDLSWRAELRDDSAVVVASLSGAITTLLPGVAKNLALSFETAQLLEGNYSLFLEVSNQGVVLHSSEQAFTLVNSPIYAAGTSLYVTPANLRSGEFNIHAEGLIRNRGNRELVLATRLQLLDPNDQVISSQPWDLTLAPGELQSFVYNFPTAALATGTHRVRLDNRDQANAPVVIEQVALVQVSSNRPPLLSLSGLPSNGRTAQSVVLQLTVLDDENPLPVAVALLNGQSYLSGTPIDQEGFYSFDATVTDASGASDHMNAQFNIDRSAPIITVENISEGAVLYGSVVPRIQIQDLNLVTSQVSLNGVPWQAGQPIEQSGTYLLSIIATDVLGQQSQLQRNFTLNPSLPLIELTGVVEGAQYNQSRTVGINLLNGSTLASFQVNGQERTPPFLLDSEGAYQISARAVKAGQSQELSRFVVLDFTPPLVVVQGVQTQGHYNHPVRPVILVDGRPASSGLSLDGVAFNSGAEVSGEGIHQIRIQALDQAGNLSDVSLQFTLDLTPPELVVSGVENGQAAPENLLITWSASDAWLDGVSAFLNDQTVTSPLVISQQGNYSLRLSARDRAGNSISRQIAFSRVQGRQLTLVAEPAQGGSLSGAGVWAEGSQAPITASANQGFRFLHWTGEGVADADLASTFVDMSIDRQVTAVFVSSWELVLNIDPLGAGTVSGAGFYDQGSQAPISASALGDYRFTGWLGEGVVDATAVQTFVEMTAQRNITASFHHNRAPVLNAPLDPQVAAIDHPFEYLLPEQTFSDPDGDALSLTATLNNGDPLPSWLLFDSQLERFSGVPASEDLGTVSVRLTAQDNLGARVTASFNINVINNAPANLSGVVFNDSDANGRHDTNESGLSGWEFFLDLNQDGVMSNDEPSVSSDAQGRYSFTDLSPGTYTVRVVAQPDWTATLDLPNLIGSPRALNLSQPYKLHSDQLNGDTLADLIFTHEDGGHISVLFSRGDGSFLPPLSLSTGQGSRAIASGDLDGDYAVDLVTTNDTAGSISVFRNLGGNSFAAAVDLAVGTLPDSTVVADLDGDQVLDLAVANSGSGTLSVLLNRAGIFDPALNFTAGLGPRQIQAADLDGDGLPELLVIADNQLLALQNLGTGHFSAPAAVYANGTPGAPVSGDWNGDGDLDLAFVDGSNQALVVLFNDGTGAFLPPLSMACSGAPQAVISSDQDGDHDLDLLVSVANPAVLQFFENREGDFAAPIAYGLPAPPGRLVAADLDGDHDPDPVVLAGTTALNAYVLTHNLYRTLTLAVGESLENVDFGQHQPVSLRMLAPNGGESLNLCQSQTLRWEPGNLSGNMMIELSRDGGATFETLFEQTANDGEQIWIASGTPSSAALIRITNLDQNISDESDGVFNLNGQLDQDRDCIPDSLDQCPASITTATIVINGCDSGVANAVSANGCSRSDQIANCGSGNPARWQFVNCVSALADQWLASQLITSAERSAIINCASAYGLPTANPDGYTTNWSTNLDITAPGVLANDSDPENNPLQAHLLQQPERGSLTLHLDGSFHYVPELGYAGNVTFVYKAWDGTGFRTAPVTITITPGNLAPVTGNDSYDALVNTRLVVAAPGVLANDSDPEGQPLTAYLYQTPNVGTVGFSGDGSFWYDPPANYTGPVQFLYRAGDGLQKTTGTVTINVNNAKTAHATK